MKSFNVFGVVRAIVFAGLGLLTSYASAETLQTKQLKEVPGKVLYAGNSFFITTTACMVISVKWH